MIDSYDCIQTGQSIIHIIDDCVIKQPKFDEEEDGQQ